MIAYWILTIVAILFAAGVILFLKITIIQSDRRLRVDTLSKHIRFLEQHDPNGVDCLGDLAFYSRSYWASLKKVRWTISIILERSDMKQENGNYPVSDPVLHESSERNKTHAVADALSQSYNISFVGKTRESLIEELEVLLGHRHRERKELRLGESMTARILIQDKNGVMR